MAYTTYMKTKMERKYLVAAVVGVAILGAGTTYAIWREGGVPAPYESIAPSATSTDSLPAAEAPESFVPDRQYGGVTISLNEALSFPDGLSIRPVAVLEDSRCPQNARCVRAGTVKVLVRIRSGSGSSESVFEPGTTITTEAESITLLGVSPERTTDSEISEGEYRFAFEVRKRPGVGVTPDPTEPPGNSGGCYVGGCSSQLCTDSPNAVSTCEYRAEYACYQGATCERQRSGECGWTENSTLRSCLANPPAL